MPIRENIAGGSGCCFKEWKKKKKNVKFFCDLRNRALDSRVAITGYNLLQSRLGNIFLATRLKIITDAVISPLGKFNSVLKYRSRHFGGGGGAFNILSVSTRARLSLNSSPLNLHTGNYAMQSVMRITKPFALAAGDYARRGSKCYPRKVCQLIRAAVYTRAQNVMQYERSPVKHYPCVNAIDVVRQTRSQFRSHTCILSTLFIIN